MNDHTENEEIFFWSGYTLKDIDRLNFIEKGKSTDELIKILSNNIVACGVRIYRIMSEIESSINPINRKQIILASKKLGYSVDAFLKLIEGFGDPIIKKRISLGQHLYHSREQPKPLFRVFKVSASDLENLSIENKKVSLIKKVPKRKDWFKIYIPTDAKKFREAFHK